MNEQPTTRYSYLIDPRPTDLGGGWRLRLVEDALEVGGGVFPVRADAAPYVGIAWWNDLTEDDRARWLAEAHSATPRDAGEAHLRQEAHFDALEEATAWLASREFA